MNYTVDWEDDVLIVLTTIWTGASDRRVELRSFSPGHRWAPHGDSGQHRNLLVAFRQCSSHSFFQGTRHHDAWSFLEHAWGKRSGSGDLARSASNAAHQPRCPFIVSTTTLMVTALTIYIIFYLIFFFNVFFLRIIYGLYIAR